MVMVEQRNRDGGTVKKRDGETVELIMVDQWNRYGGKVEQ